MKIRTRIRRWWVGGDLYDHAAYTIASAENAEAAGRDEAYAFIRKVHARYGPPEPPGFCSVPNCCPRRVGYVER